MTRFVALLAVAIIAGTSARLLVCDYSCVEHTRAAASSQPACHEQEHDQPSAAFTAGQNDCDQQTMVLAGFVVGKITTVAKPAVTLLHAVPLGATINVVRAAHWRAPARMSLPTHQTTPLRI